MSSGMDSLRTLTGLSYLTPFGVTANPFQTDLCRNPQLHGRRSSCREVRDDKLIGVKVITYLFVHSVLLV